MRIAKIVLTWLFCSSALSITHWEQGNKMSQSSQDINVSFTLRATDLVKGQYYDKWSTTISDKTKVKFAIVDGEKVKPIVKNGVLSIPFKHKLYNNDSADITFEVIKQYSEKYIDKQFIKCEYVSIPSYAHGAQGSLHLTIPDDYIIYGKLKYLNNMSWQGTVPKNGISEYIMMTLNEAFWNVSSHINIKSNTTLNTISLKTHVPYYGGNNVVKVFKVNKKYKKKNSYIFIEDMSIRNSREYVISALVHNKSAEYNMGNLPSYSDSKYDVELDDIKELMDVISQKFKGNKPIHVQLCHWIHKYIRYEKGLTSCTMSPLEIYKRRKGVCAHYALLYKMMLNSIDIPCYVVYGLAYSVDEDIFIPHAWNIVFYEDQWIPIDPTWDISSGVVPISHLYFGVDLDDHNHNMEVITTYTPSSAKINIQLNQQAQFVNK